MTQKKRIVAISGSTRAQSSNMNLIHAIQELTHEIFEWDVIADVSTIPHFNPDLDNESPPEGVATFRNALKQADGILICTPEYAMGVPGSLKNAIDWTVSSCEFSHKPTTLITASSIGQKGHASLLETLKIIESKITDETQLIIPHVKIKVSKEGKITDESTLNQVNQLLSAFERLIC